jgi:hypothetical protein
MDAKVHGSDEAAGALIIFYMAAGFQGEFFCFTGRRRVVAFVVGSAWFVGHDVVLIRKRRDGR